MRTAILTSLAAVTLLAAPALAQSSNQAGGQQEGQPAASPQAGAEVQAMSQERLRKSLEQAGFKNVTVLDATYLVQAQSPDGDRVMMLIDPPAVGSGSGGGGNQPSQGGSSTQQ